METANSKGMESQSQSRDNSKSKTLTSQSVMSSTNGMNKHDLDMPQYSVMSGAPEPEGGYREVSVIDPKTGEVSQSMEYVLPPAIAPVSL